MLGNSPGENPAVEVVDDGIEVGMSTVEESDDGRVDVPNLVRPGPSDADLRFGGMHALTRSTPTVNPNEPIPGGRRCEHLAESLREDGERTGGDVSVVV
jgi:hypothetical protein